MIHSHLLQFLPNLIHLNHHTSGAATPRGKPGSKPGSYDTTMATTNPPTYYEILNLSPLTTSQQPNPSQLIKRAYRRALLSHHPDKKFTAATPSTTASPTFTIDQISTAYAILSNPTSRASYDKLLLTTASTTNPLPSQFQTGIETIDLDDLEYDASKEEWYRPCRCGNTRGYRFGEADLEDSADLGELMVGCVDCSLWLRVQFAVVADKEQLVGEDGDQVGAGGS
jgi:diphthamide biosynthesis protein 4